MKPPVANPLPIILPYLRFTGTNRHTSTTFSQYSLLCSSCKWEKWNDTYVPIKVRTQIIIVRSIYRKRNRNVKPTKHNGVSAE